MKSSPSVLISADAPQYAMAKELPAVMRALDTMVASAEPAVVFASAVRLCVPLICDSVTVTITGPEQHAYAITWPPSATERHHLAPAATVSTPICGEPTEAHPGFRGTLTLSLHSPPAHRHAVLARLVADRATALVHRERLTDLVDHAVARAAKQDAALGSNRDIGVAIGILMSLRKITRDPAFDVLCAVSQRTHRKIRAIAMDVIDAGATEPLIARRSPTPNATVRVVGNRSGRPLARCAS
jgi:ANTAR domain